MHRILTAAIGIGAAALVASTLAAAPEPSPAPGGCTRRRPRPRRRRPRVPNRSPRRGPAHAGDDASGADRTGGHLLRHLPQRAGQGRRAVAGRLQRDAGARVAGDGREDGPQAARRDDAAGRREAAARRRARRPGARARDAAGRVRGGQPESGLAALPAAQPRRVRPRGEGPARRRRRCLGAAAARHHQPRFRQRRRRADVLADAARRLPARGQPRDRAGRGRPRELGQRGHLQPAQDRLAAGPRRRARRSAPAAASR